MSIPNTGYDVREISRETTGSFDTRHMRINVGPQHPSTHGVLRLVCLLYTSDAADE